MTTETTTTHLSVDELIEHGDDLLSELAEHVGDPAAVTSVLTAWRDHLGPDEFERVAVTGLLTIFTDCLTRVPITDVPPGALTLTERTPA